MEIGPYQQSVLRALGAGSFYAVLHPDWITTEEVITSGVSGDRMTATEVTKVYENIDSVPSADMPILIMYGTHIASRSLAPSNANNETILIGQFSFFKCLDPAVVFPDNWFARYLRLFAMIMHGSSRPLFGNNFGSTREGGNQCIFVDNWTITVSNGSGPSRRMLILSANQTSAPSLCVNSTVPGIALTGSLAGVSSPFTNKDKYDFSLSTYGLNDIPPGRYGVGKVVSFVSGSTVIDEFGASIDPVKSISGLTRNASGVSLLSSTGIAQGELLSIPIYCAGSRVGSAGILLGLGLSNLKAFLDNKGFGSGIVIDTFYRLGKTASECEAATFTKISWEIMSPPSYRNAKYIQLKVVIKRVK